MGICVDHNLQGRPDANPVEAQAVEYRRECGSRLESVDSILGSELNLLIDSSSMLIGD